MAATLGVTRKTIYNWLELPCFRAVVDRLTVDHAEEVTNQLGAKSLAVVEEALDARHIKPRNFSERLSAARIGMQVAGINGQGATREAAAGSSFRASAPSSTDSRSIMPRRSRTSWEPNPSPSWRKGSTRA
ncbi:MAG: hypothetical protein A2Z48_08770 [Actinobacteria bacterium RBG_19FT_COMBO_70_19]|nr:MAG: hypothetical protein A2Y55_06715 [Actinobacteria bacterium RBG_16_68_12]OFW79006.1 MAG: hypothetical protein A2Z48_08770 [Actinobacteria bacterium RBG_19FT_COMBO_70_19]